MYTNNIFESNTLLFKKNRKVYPIKVDEIVYLSKRNGITYVHLSDGEIKEYRYVSFIRIISDSCNQHLFMCNKSTIVNIKYIYALDPTNCFVVLKENRGLLDVGGAYCNRLVNNIEQLCESSREEKFFLIRNHSIRYLIELKELSHVESFERYMHIYLLDGSEIKVSQKPIRYLLDIVNSDKLIFCARGIAVYMENVSAIDFTHWSIILQNGRIIKIGEIYRKKLKEVWKKIKEERSKI